MWRPKDRVRMPRAAHIRNKVRDHVLERMDPNIWIKGYRRRPDDLPSRTEALGRVFRAALWAIRVKPVRERRIAAIAGMRKIDTDIKQLILGLANLLRVSPPHPRIRWPVRKCNARK
eukprot:1706677-Prymnesium_polylepis.1